MKGKIVLYIIFILTIIFLLMNIKIRNDLIWQQRVEIEDLKEQIDRKSYDDIPIYDFNFYKLERDNCKYCRTEFYYLVDLVKE